MLGFITRDQLDAIRAVDQQFNYDTAIPQSIFDCIMSATDQNPCGHVVFVYQKGMVGGYLQATSQDGGRILAEYFRKG